MEKSPVTPNIGKTPIGSNTFPPGNSPTSLLASRTSSQGESFPSKVANKVVSKHGEHSGGFGMDFSASNYSGNFDKYSDGNENDMADFNKLSKGSKIDERTSMKKPTAKSKGPKKVPVKSTSAKDASPQVKGDSKKEKASKAKISKQPSKISNGPEGKPKNSAKSTPKSDKKSKMPNERRGKKRLPSPNYKSREFVSDSSDSDDESVSKSSMKSPCKINGTSDSTHSLSPKASACSKSNVTKGKNKTKPERTSVYSVSSVDDVFTNFSPCDEPILSPLKSPDLMSEIHFNKSGIPSLVVRFDLSDIDNLPTKDDGRTHSRTCSPRSKRGVDVADGLDERPPPLVKSKRKPEDMDPEVSGLLKFCLPEVPFVMLYIQTGKNRAIPFEIMHHMWTVLEQVPQGECEF